MKSLDVSHLWFAMGISLGAIVALQAAAVSFETTGENWIYKYQTLIGAVATLVAAYFAVIGILMQIGASQKESEARKAGRLKAAIAMLPLATHELQLHVGEIAERITSILDKAPLFSDSPGPGAEVIRTRLYSGYINPEPLPEKAFTILKELVELAPNKVGGELAETMKEFQLFSASLKSPLDWAYDDGLVDYQEDFLLSRLTEQVQLYARILRIASYASNEEEITSGRISEEEFERAGRRALGIHGRYLKSLKCLRSNCE